MNPLPFHSGSELKFSVPKKVHIFLKYLFENIYSEIEAFPAQVCTAPSHRKSIDQISSFA